LAEKNDVSKRLADSELKIKILEKEVSDSLAEVMRLEVFSRSK
jgi:hypothetical protein